MPREQVNVRGDDRQWRTLAWGAALLGVAGVLAFVPLFDLLGYESSFVLGLVAAVAAAHLGAESAWRWRRRATAADLDRVDASPLRAIARRAATGWLRALAITLPAVGVLALNALRVRNCDLAQGFAWAALLPGFSTAMGTIAGLCAGLATRRRLAGSALAIAIILGSVVWSVVRFYRAPPVFAYDPFGGYFPGSIYDAEVAPGGTLVLARALHLLFGATALALVALFLDGETLRLRLRAAFSRRREALIAIVLGLGSLYAWHAEPRLGIAPDAAAIADALGGRRDTAHLTLLYSPSGPWARDLDLYAADAELRWRQLARFFGVQPTERITCYLFDNAGEKRRWTGASATQIAKPWRREIYIQFEGWPHPVIKHELAHVFAGEFGDPIFHVARRGLAFNVGLIEGAAVAAEGRADYVSLDQAVKIMREDHLEPALSTVFATGFLTLPPARAYTVAGSFCRFLVEKYGIERFRAVYRSGGDWRAAYGRSLDELGAEWSQRIDAVTVDRKEAAPTAERLRRPAIFHQVCAHDLAVRAEQASELSVRGKLDEALAVLRSICRDDPDDPARLGTLMDAYHNARRDDDARRTAESLLAHPKAAPSDQGRALSLLGDLKLARGDASADEDYRRALALPLGEPTLRQLRARHLAVGDTPFARALARYLVGDGLPRDGALEPLRAQQVADAAPDVGLGHYLVGRQLAAHDRHAEALADLDRALALGLPDPGFTVETRRLAAISAYRAGKLAESRALFTQLATDGSTPHEVRAEAEDFLARLDDPG